MAKQLPTLSQDKIITNQNLPKSIHFKDGFMMLINKQQDWTSFDVVNKLRFKVRYKLGIKRFKVGHAGTLDPMATGLLLVCAGKYTKLIDGFTNDDKSYEARIRLGGTTASYDAETDVENQMSTDHLTVQNIKEAIATFEGEQSQIPPIYSAIKIDGQAAYKLARRGKEVEMKARTITVHTIKSLSIENPDVDLDIFCTKGTYIRSIAHDLGQKLGVGGYLTSLVRTSVGEYQNIHALEVDEAAEWIENVKALDEDL